MNIIVWKNGNEMWGYKLQEVDMFHIPIDCKHIHKVQDILNENDNINSFMINPSTRKLAIEMIKNLL